MPQVFGCMYYLLFASVLRKHLSDTVLMVVLSIPSTLAVIPALVFLKVGQGVVIENKAANYRATAAAVGTS